MSLMKLYAIFANGYRSKFNLTLLVFKCKRKLTHFENLVGGNNIGSPVLQFVQRVLPVPVHGENIPKFIQDLVG